MWNLMLKRQIVHTSVTCWNNNSEKAGEIVFIGQDWIDNETEPIVASWRIKSTLWQIYRQVSRRGCRLKQKQTCSIASL